MVSFSFFETKPHYVAQAGLKLLVPLPVPHKKWDCRCDSHYAQCIIFTFMRRCPPTFHSCGQWYSPGSSNTPLSPCRSPQHARYIGRAGSWESPSTQGDTGHTAEHICPGNSGTGPWQHRRKHSQILVDCSHKLQTRQTKNSLNRHAFTCARPWSIVI